MRLNGNTIEGKSSAHHSRRHLASRFSLANEAPGNDQKIARKPDLPYFSWSLHSSAMD
jgi:hypothetical protein